MTSKLPPFKQSRLQLRIISLQVFFIKISNLVELFCILVELLFFYFFFSIK